MGKKGMLLFKGDKKRPKKKSKKSKTDRDKNHHRGEQVISNDSVVPATHDNLSHSAEPRPKQQSAASAALVPTIETGKGRITTSGTVVTGHGTKFEREISIGDAILVTIHHTNDDDRTRPDEMFSGNPIVPKRDNPSQPTEEMRIVTMRLSDVSLNLSSAFSKNLSEPTSFRYVKKPRDLQQEQRKKRQKQREATNALEQSVYDIYKTNNGNSNTYTYREKTETGSYRIKQGSLTAGSTSSRGEMLALRTKKSSDKFC